MPFPPPPPFAAWRHRDVRDGFEAVFLDREDDGYRLDGATTAVEEGEPWVLRYAIRLASDWTTAGAWISGRSARGAHELRLDADGAGRWHVNGEASAELDGCLDADLESSALTNAFPVRRLELAVGEEADAPAAWVRAFDLRVERLEQRYLRLEDVGNRRRYRYAAPDLAFECELLFDEFGLVLDYPGIATRAA